MTFNFLQEMSIYSLSYREESCKEKLSACLLVCPQGQKNMIFVNNCCLPFMVHTSSDLGKSGSEGSNVGLSGSEGSNPEPVFESKVKSTFIQYIATIDHGSSDD